MFARNQLRQVPPLLLAPTMTADLIDAQIGMRAIGKTDRSRSARNLLHDDAMFDIAESRPAVLFLDSDAKHAKASKLRPKLARKLVAPVDVIGEWSNFIHGKAPHALANGIGSIAEPE